MSSNSPHQNSPSHLYIKHLFYHYTTVFICKSRISRLKISKNHALFIQIFHPLVFFFATNTMAPTFHFWGEPTSNVNWCEHDYVVSPYIAEFWNTITSFLFALMGFLGMWLISDGHSVTFWSFFWLCVIGLGSASFHGTLQYGAQLLDELPMIFGSVTFIYSLTILDLEFQSKGTLKVLLILYCVISCILMGYLSHSPAILPILYLILVVAIIHQSRKVLSLTKFNPTAKKLFWISLTAYLSGGICWILERPTCHNLFYLQLHAWWHVGSGLGTYLHCLFASYCRAFLHNRSPVVRWRFGFWPVLQLNGKQD